MSNVKDERGNPGIFSRCVSSWLDTADCRLLFCDRPGQLIGIDHRLVSLIHGIHPCTVGEP